MDINKSKFVWLNKTGEGRDLYAKFRKTFNLSSNPKEATFQIFADTFYQLYVNGEFVGFGPVRFSPEFPQYDEYNLSEYLTEGDNVIAVCVNYFGSKSYKAIPNRAGFIAAGKCSTCSEEVDFSTFESTWKCSSAPEHNRYVPKLSFALPTTEVINQKYLEYGWTEAAFDDSAWEMCVDIDRQDSWGELEKRYIPFMSLDKVVPASKFDVFPLDNKLDIYSFDVPFPDFHSDNPKHEPFIAFATWIWSPLAQRVPLTSFWGETWLNGVETPPSFEDQYRNMKLNTVLDLNEGWNFFFGKVKVYQDCVCQFYGVPSDKGLIFAADKKKNSKYSFKHTQPLRFDEYNETLAKKELPYLCDDELPEIGGWTYVKKENHSESPVRWSSWDEYGSQIVSCSFDELQGKVFKKEDYPQGLTLKVDLGGTKLVFPKIKISGTKGARVDLFGSEKESTDRRYLYTEFLFQIGDRIICDGEYDFVDFMPLQPRGYRFFNLTIRDIQEDITIEQLEFLSASYPVEHIGSFECSDPLLNDIWKLCEKTQEANMEDAYDDCVTRERGMYTFDVMIQYNNNLASFGDHLLMKRCMELYCQSTEPISGKYRAVYPNDGTYTISSFCLYNIEAIYNYYMQTDDAEFVNKHWASMLKNMKPFDKLSEQRVDRLIMNDISPAPGSAEEVAGTYCGDDHVIKPITGLHCEYSCTYLKAVMCMEKMADVVCDYKNKEYYSSVKRILSDSISEKFFNEELGTFMRYYGNNEVSNHPACLAARVGAVSDEQIDSVQRYLRKNLRSAFVNGYNPSDGVIHTPAYNSLVIDGLYAADLPDVAQNFIKSGWGWFVIEGLANIPEYHDLGGSMSLCHAWSASPMYYLSREMSGIRFVNLPNKDYFVINVKAHEIEWAKVKWPHEKGVITIEWHMEDGKRVFDLIDVPDGVSYSIIE